MVIYINITPRRQDWVATTDTMNTNVAPPQLIVFTTTFTITTLYGDNMIVLCLVLVVQPPQTA